MRKLVQLASIGAMIGAFAGGVRVTGAQAMEVFSEARADFAPADDARKAWFNRAVDSILSGSDQQTAQGPQIGDPTPTR